MKLKTLQFQTEIVKNWVKIYIYTEHLKIFDIKRACKIIIGELWSTQLYSTAFRTGVMRGEGFF